MAESQGPEPAIRELEAALETEQRGKKNYHIRQALQFLELDDEGGTGSDVGS